MVDKLQLSVQPHPQSYVVGWLNDDCRQQVTSQCHISFSIGKYQDFVPCDVLEMIGCHMLLGRPWQFDIDIIHQDKDNTYAFVKDGFKFILAPYTSKPQSPSRENHTCSISNDIVEDSTETGCLAALIVQEVPQDDTFDIPCVVLVYLVAEADSSRRMCIDCCTVKQHSYSAIWGWSTPRSGFSRHFLVPRDIFPYYGNDADVLFDFNSRTSSLQDCGRCRILDLAPLHPA